MAAGGRPLHFGVQLQAQRTSWADWASAVRAVEQLGYGSVWTFDHLLPFAGPDDGPAFETLTTLGAMALLTERARIGVLVNGVLYREPAVLAKAAAQVDEMSGGRLEFSLGAAWAEREFKAYGMDFPPFAERYARLDEALQLIKLLWGQHRTTFEGTYYQAHDAPCEPKPVQAPHPPITIGGTGTGSLRIAAKHADRLNMIGSPEQCAGFSERLRQLHPLVAIARQRPEAETLAASIAASNGTDLAAVHDRWIIGDPHDVKERLRPYLEVGITHFVFAVGPPFDMAPLRLLREEVLDDLG
jgi:alkanesulfonate monooxygenase SsuD/methylene tetrahydromethanopterin reductase-like flavin-dependent oxidoreductase (luciferase family)